MLLSGDMEPQYEIPLCKLLHSNSDGKNGGGQCLVGSLCGAQLSQRVMERSIKVSLGRMEIGLDVQRHKLA